MGLLLCDKLDLKLNQVAYAVPVVSDTPAFQAELCSSVL